MFNKTLKNELTARTAELATYKGLVGALERSMAVIEFSPDGKVLRANENFLGTMGYRADQLASLSHRDFAPQRWWAAPSIVNSGTSCAPANLFPARFSAVARKARTCGWKLAITR